MHRQLLLDLLDSYQKTWAAGKLPYSSFNRVEEQSTLERLREFAERRPDCLERSCVEGHITASAMVVDFAREKVLLTLHAKLGKWLQLGGHVDGESAIHLAALREAQEESGQESVSLLTSASPLFRSLHPGIPIPFDLDIHSIPARKQDAEHFHFDLRFICQLDSSLPIAITEESSDLRWIALHETKSLTRERSMERQFCKLSALIAHGEIG